MLFDILKRARLFERDAHRVLSHLETASSRVITLEYSYNKLSGLSIYQDELLREALRCVEGKLFRAAHVMAWAGFMDWLENKVFEEGLSKLSACRPKWNLKNIEALREDVPEYQLVEAFSEVGLYSKSENKTLMGLLSKRNECAHPSAYFPDLNETLGFVSELLHRIEIFSARSL